MRRITTPRVAVAIAAVVGLGAPALSTASAAPATPAESTAAHVARARTAAAHAAPARSAAAHAAPARSAAATAAYTVQPIRVPVLIGPSNQRKCRIDADIYRPVGVDRQHKAPAILTTNGFGGSKSDSNETAAGKGFAQAGYVVLAYTGLGFGNSSCRIFLDNPRYDGKAGKQLVSVLAGEKNAIHPATGKRFRIHYVAQEKPGDPRVGMIGGSYGGEIQYAVAKQDPRVDALIPIITWNDLSYSLAPNNTSFARGVTYRTAGVYKREWTNLFFGVGIKDGIQRASAFPMEAKGCVNFDQRACTAKSQMDAFGYPDATTVHLARAASVTSYLDRIKIPTLVVQGQNDTLFNLQEAAATYKGLRKQGTETRMIWQSWGHSGSTPAPGELDLGAHSIRDTYLGRRFVSWMNHWVRGRQAAPVGPRFCYFRDWVHYNTDPSVAGTAVAKAYSCHRRYTGDDRNATLYFTGDTRLTKSAAGVMTGSQSFVTAPKGTPTSYSETSGVQDRLEQTPPYDLPPSFASFSTRPLAHAVHIVGIPHLTVHLDAPSFAQSQTVGPVGKLVLFAKVYDVAPGGALRLQHRLISPVRVADVTKPVHVQLPGVVQRIKAGHSIRVVLAASDFAYDGNQTGGLPLTVTTRPKAPSTLQLPLTGGGLSFQ